MAKRSHGKSALEDYEINVIIGDGTWEWAGGKGVTRAVIKLARDISQAMPEMSRLIEGAGYSPEANAVGFSYKGMGVIVEPRQITINNAGDEATAREVLNWLLDKIKKPESK